MFELIMYQPEIPPNTGNIIRLCANAGSRLHLIHPLGFELDEKRLRRAGLDYRELMFIEEHTSLDECREKLGHPPLYGVSTRGGQRYDGVRFSPGDALLFGPETRGLPVEVLEALPEERRLRIPMVPESRSLNVSNAASIVLYEAWRQNDFQTGR